MILSDNVPLSRDQRERLSGGRLFISRRCECAQPLSTKPLPGAGMSLLGVGCLGVGRHFGTKGNAEDRDKVWWQCWVCVAGTVLLLVPSAVQGSQVRGHQPHCLSSFPESSREEEEEEDEDEEGPREAMLSQCQVELPAALWIPVVFREHLPGAMPTKQENLGN